MGDFGLVFFLLEGMLGFRNKLKLRVIFKYLVFFLTGRDDWYFSD